MKSPRHKLAVAALSLVGLVLLVYVTAYFLVRSESARNRIEFELGRRTGYHVQIHDLRLAFPVRWVASGVVVSEAGRALLQAERITAVFWPWDFFTARISRLTFESPEIRLPVERLFSSSAQPAPRLSIGSLNIANGRVVLQTDDNDGPALQSIFLTATNVSLGAAAGVELRTHVPALRASAVVSVSGGPGARQAEILLDQDSTPAALSASGKVQRGVVARLQLKSKPQGAYEVTGAGTVTEFRIGPERISGRFDGVLEADRKFEQLRLALDFSVADFPTKLVSAGRPMQAGPLRGALQGRYSTATRTFAIDAIKMTSSVGALAAEGAIDLRQSPVHAAVALRLRDVALDAVKSFLPHPLDDFSYSGKVAADLKVSGPYREPAITGLAWSDSVSAKGDELSVSRLAFKFPVQWTDSSFRIREGRLQLSNLERAAAGATRWKFQEAALVTDVVKEPRAPFAMNGDFQVTGAGFVTPDQTKVGENLAAKGRFDYTERDGVASFGAEARIESLELLWHQFFRDFRQQKTAIATRGSYRRDRDELNLETLRVAFASAGEIELAGQIRGLLGTPTFAIDAGAGNLLIGGVYDFFIREPFRITYPILGRVQLAGKSSFEVRAAGALDAFTLEGSVRLQDGLVRDQDGSWRIGPVTLELPFKVRFPEAGEDQAPGVPRAGKLLIDGVQTASSTVAKIDATPVLWNNALRFAQPIRMSLFGGSGTVEGLAWKDVIGAPRDIAFSLKLDGLRLLELTGALGWYRFGGTLSGAIPEVRWTGQSLRSAGTVVLDVFGGRVTVRGMEIERPLSPIRSIRMDVILEDLNLEQASETFELGRISGVLAGTVNNLVITNGQPSQFRADVETVERQGTSQWISVEALNKITVLSSGNDAGSLYSGLATFFDFFRYSRLGFKATLKNDRLLLRGIESKDGKEYLVVGTVLPPTVNIISHTQEIAFSELLRRLERVKEKNSR